MRAYEDRTLTMTSKKVWCYGSLLQPQVQVDLWGRVKTGHVGELLGVYVAYDEAFPRLKGSERKNVAALGRVLELDEDELYAACVYEGESYHFSEVTLASGEKVWCFL